MEFQALLETTKNTAKIILSGELKASTAPIFKTEVEKAAATNPQRLVLVMKDLSYMASAGLRVLIFAKQKMGANVDIYLISPQEMVIDTIKKTGFHHSVKIMDEYNNDKVEA